MAEVKNYVQLKDFFKGESVELINWYSKIKHNLNKESFNSEGIGETCIYGDPFFDTYLIYKKDFIQKQIKKDLLPLSSIFKTYVKGSTEPFSRRSDLYEITCVINMGDDGVSWPLIIGNEKKDELELPKGEAIVFSGNIFDSGRKGTYEGDHMFLLELHYGFYRKHNECFRYDGRMDLGTPPLQKK